MSTPQVEKNHYEFSSYGFEGRFVSYYWQLREVLSRKPQTVLEVGVGDKVFGEFICNNTIVGYRSVDIAEDLSPDVIGSITALPEADNSHDITCAFEVLEHLPFSECEKAVSELARVGKQYMVVSVPHYGPMVSFSLKIPLLPKIQIAVKIPIPKKHVFNGQHYWELGKNGYPPRLLRAILRKHGTIVRDFIPFNSEYHHFFVVKLS